MKSNKIFLRKDEQETIIKIFSFLESDQEKLCLFSHFDTDNMVDDYVVFFIKELNSLGFDVIFVTTSEKIKIGEIKKLENYITQAVVRKNIGYDFISWKIGLSQVENYQKYKQILNTNDSIFFPITDPNSMFEEMNKRNVDFWGIINGIYYEEFMESFFIVFNQELIKSLYFERFWNECKIYLKKSDVVRKYELKLLKYIQDNNFTTSAFVDYKQLFQFSKLNINEVDKIRELDKTGASFKFWDTLIEDFKVPFIKKKILLKTHIDFNQTTFSWEDKLQKNINYDTKLISNYLARVGKEQDDIYDDEFFYNIEQLYSIFDRLKNKKFNIYGYGSFGVFIHTIFYKNINKVFDRDCEILNKSFAKEILSSNKTISFADENFLITAVGNEKTIKEFLLKDNIKKDNIFEFSDNITNIELFSFKFLKLISRINNFYFYKESKQEKHTYCIANKKLVEILNYYYDTIDMKFIEIKTKKT
jgi:hypothetical protein